MDTNSIAATVATSEQDQQSSCSLLSGIAPTPINIEQTGLPIQLLKELLLKHIHDRAVSSIKQLSKQLKLSGPVIEQTVQLLRDEAMVELSSNNQGDGSLCFRVTERGRFNASIALERSGYIGPAPIPLSRYEAICNSFTLRQHMITKAAVSQAFDNFIIEPNLLDQLGSAFNSRRAIFIYGSAGTGKTYTIGNMVKLFKDRCLVPYAIAIGNNVVQVYDPQIHHAIDNDNQASGLLYSDSFDQRLVQCQRPVVITGGELTADLLEVQHDPRTKINLAPLQLKANNGIFFIDDIGRQSIPPLAIFNRWIVPMEEGRDFLSLANGQHFEVPFDVQLVFSSNIAPKKLADEAVLRRIGFKIHFEDISPSAYKTIWQQECKKLHIDFDGTVVDFTLEHLHKPNGVRLLPCHPRDLINMALTQSAYLGQPGTLTADRISWAWKNYFVQLDDSMTESNSQH
jgi:hypothetical protein